MFRRLAYIIAGLAVVVLAALGYLLATGERGLSGRADRIRSPFEPRTVETYRADTAEAERLGWSPGALDRVLDYVSRLSADTFIIMTDGEVVASLGDLDQPHSIHSARKAMLSAVVGQHVGGGPNEVPLDATLEELGIDDSPGSLTPLQRRATVLDLLHSKSGINHPAAAEGGLTAEKDERLGNTENEPGTIWAYNNWDYNALTTIFEQSTGLSVAQAFETGIAEPTGMEDYTLGSVSYSEAPDRSQHKAAMFKMSGRDLGRFGQLYLDQGVVDDAAVLPGSWINRITTDFAETGIGGLRAGHGFLWWLPDSEAGLPEGSYFAWGLGQQSVFVIPAWNTVIVHQSDTTEFLKRWFDLQRQGVDGDTALEQILEGCLEKEALKTEFCREHRFTGRREFNRLISAVAAARQQNGS
ncbi:serine hydrolase [Stappia sp. ES.058]|uniref:serine hydrolase domain-containing protein n=1 Tax=Stappia sp. ES.058 TaxID=1881061 RepID=UPI00087CC96D|nr:serine hydrolase [Stappia sp. ES.058]SDU23150.1 CubicO group peptidase, beta-lactamase class C family [Stappia sp. ES.058]